MRIFKLQRFAHACSFVTTLSGICLLTAVVAPAAIPISFDLPAPAHVTLVLEDNAGHRVANLIADTYLPAGHQTISWDGYDVGKPGEGATDGHPAPITRRKVSPGNYHVRGLVHDGLHLIYEFPVYSPGTPPWFTHGLDRDGSGGWLADHSPPADILLLPPGSSPYGDPHAPQLLISSQVSEQGSAMVWANLDGRRLMGKRVFDWSGGYATTRDLGPKVDPGVAAYLASTAGPQFPQNPSGAIDLWRTDDNADTTKIVSYQPTDKPITVSASQSGLGVAVYNGIAVISDDLNGQLAIIDIKAKAILGTVPLPRPTGLAFDNEGALFVLTDRSLNKYTLDVSSGKPTLTNPQIVISSGLDDPRRLRIRNDMLLISDWGNSNQVKLFHLNGKPISVIGKAGPEQVGTYDELQMNHPLGAEIDPAGHLWVAECDFLPKRVSVWSISDGTLLNAYYGGPQYGGGGMLDPADKTKFYYASSFNYASHGGLEFSLEWAAGSAKLTDIYARFPWPKYESSVQFNQCEGLQNDTNITHQSYYDAFDRSTWQYDEPDAAAPERSIQFKGRQYLTNAFNGWERGNAGNSIYLMSATTHTIRPVVAVGTYWSLVYRPSLAEKGLKNYDAIAAGFKGKPYSGTIFVWSDLNADGIVQPEEIQYIDMKTAFPGENYNGGGTAYVDDQLNLTTSFGVQLKPVMITVDGVPVYDIKAAKRLANITGVSQPVPGRDSWLVDASTPMFTGYHNGNTAWQYPTYGYYFTPKRSDQMVQPTRIIGPTFTPTSGEAGEMFAINGEKGSLYLMTMDGLYVENLGGDVRTTPLVRFPEAIRGMDIVGHSLEDENFHPTLEQLDNGEIYCVLGKEYSGIFHLTGLETVHRRDFGSIDVTAEQLAALPDTVAEQVDKRSASSVIVDRNNSFPLITAADKVDATSSNLAVIDDHSQANLAIVGQFLYVTYHTDQPTLLENAGGDDAVLFRHGGGLDLMLASDLSGHPLRQTPIAGDCRLFVTRVKGVTKAVLYQAIVPGTPPEHQTQLVSPTGTVTFDSIVDVSENIQLADDGKGNYQFSVPLKLLQWNPQAGKSYRGDVGVLRGDGTKTIQRSYWTNRDAGNVSDVPSEARLTPISWGEFTIH